MDQESFQIYLNSEFADVQKSSTNDVEFHLPTIEVDSQYHLYASITSASIPVSYYNVNNNNNLIVYDTSSTVYRVTIPIGNYTVNQLVATLNSILTNFTVTYNDQTNKMMFIHNSLNYTFRYEIGFYSTAFELLGFSKYSQISVARVLSSNICCNLEPIRMFCICSNLPTGNMNNSNPLKQNILCQIPVDQSKYGVVNYINPTRFKCNLYTNIINSVEIMIADQNSNMIDLNGVNWSITLQLDIIKYVS